MTSLYKPQSAELYRASDGRDYLVYRHTGGQVTFTPAKPVSHPRPFADPLPLIGFGLLTGLLSLGIGFAVGYGSGAATVKAPVMMPPVCNSQSTGNFLWKSEEVRCR